MKDLFVDNNIAKDFCNPLKDSYKDLIDWLMSIGSLAVSNKIINEYHGSCQNNSSLTNILAIIAFQQKKGRLNKISNNDLKTFRIKKKISNNFRSNRADHEHIKVVLLSYRKIALSKDVNFLYDTKNYPGFNVSVAEEPELLDYKNI